MKKFILLTLLVLLSGYVVFRVYMHVKKSTEHSLVSVSVAPVIQKDVTVKSQTLGTVESYASLEIKSMVTGQLISLGFTEGDMVNKDQILFQIDPRPFTVALKQAEANLARDKSTLAKDEALLTRNKSLAKQGYTSKQEFDSIYAAAKSMAATVSAAEAAVENAKLQLEYATIRSPITGKTGNISLKPGSLIKANDTSPLVVINQISPIYVVFTLPQNRLPAINQALQNGDVIVRALHENSTIEEGKLSFVDNSVNTATGTISLKATFANSSHQLWPGQHVTVDIAIEHHEQAILIPSLAMMTGQDGFYVYVVNPDSKIEKRNVTPGASVDQLTIIENGLTFGEQIVTSGQLRVEDGDTVTIHAS